ncbi:MAG: sigma-70 family RNA polymerase sigma factor, partial [Thermoguttaceae bacterium]|nr:sigma-70 family RNA polymerase sigma factor [Thermoguttaceae bacterium]
WAMDQTDAEDILQEAFVRYWPHRAQVADPLTYLYSCVRNVAQDWRRRQASRWDSDARSDPVGTVQQRAGSPTAPSRNKPLRTARPTNYLPASSAEAEPAWFEPVDASLIHQELAQQVQEALLTLPQEQREVVVLKVWGGLSFSAIAQVMGVSPNTAASRYRYALKALQSRLAKILLPEP